MLPTVVYNLPVIEVVETEAFQHWMERLTDAVARTRILARLRRASLGNLGDWKAVGGGVAEMRVDHGPGYRVYFTRRGNRLILILAGGTKKTQAADIAKAIETTKRLE
jgi:putative addiction module killer protein